MVQRAGNNGGNGAGGLQPEDAFSGTDDASDRSGYTRMHEASSLSHEGTTRNLPSVDDPSHVDLGEFFDALYTWTQYRPEGYPITDEFHNPFVALNPQYGDTTNAYNIWCELGRTSDAAELRAALDALTQPIARERPDDQVNAYVSEAQREVPIRWDMFAR